MKERKRERERKVHRRTPGQNIYKKASFFLSLSLSLFLAHCLHLATGNRGRTNERTNERRAQLSLGLRSFVRSATAKPLDCPGEPHTRTTRKRQTERKKEQNLRKPAFSSCCSLSTFAAQKVTSSSSSSELQSKK